MNVLEKILEEIKAIGGIRFSRYTETVDCCERCGENHPSHISDATDMNDDWIPVEKRLPEDERMVLVTCQTKKGIRSTNRAYYDGAFWHGSGSMSSVTAWQPLPDPYKPK